MKLHAYIYLVITCLILSCSDLPSVDSDNFLESMTDIQIEETITQLDRLILEAKSKNSTLAWISNESTLQAIESKQAIESNNYVLNKITATKIPTQEYGKEENQQITEQTTLDVPDKSDFVIPTIIYPPQILSISSTVTPTPTPAYTSVPSNFIGGGNEYQDQHTGVNVEVLSLVQTGQQVDITYKLRNATDSKIIKEGYFFLYLNDGSASAKKGLQVDIIPGQQLTRNYKWNVTNQRTAIRVVYGGDHSLYSPIKGHLSWDVAKY